MARETKVHIPQAHFDRGITEELRAENFLNSSHVHVIKGKRPKRRARLSTVPLAAFPEGRELIAHEREKAQLQIGRAAPVPHTLSEDPDGEEEA